MVLIFKLEIRYTINELCSFLTTLLFKYSRDKIFLWGTKHSFELLIFLFHQKCLLRGYEINNMFQCRIAHQTNLKSFDLPTRLFGRRGFLRRLEYLFARNDLAVFSSNIYWMLSMRVGDGSTYLLGS